MAEYSGKRKLVGTAGSDSCTGTPHQVVLLEEYNMAYHSLSLSLTASYALMFMPQAFEVTSALMKHKDKMLYILVPENTICIYADAFGVLTETDHCYCVLLNANDGAAFPSDDPNHGVASCSEKEPQDCSSSNYSSLRIDTNLEKTKSTKLTLFSGFVSYQMVRDAYDAGKSRFGSLLSLGHSGKTDRLYMKGPGGRGEVEVAVSGVADQSQQDLGPFSPVISRRGFGIGSIVRKAASVASVAAKHAYAAAAATPMSSDDEMLPLKCCLMSISLPWEYIAHDLLFKGTPPVNL